MHPLITLVVSRQDPKRNGIAQEYVLPNFSTNRQGRIKQRHDILADDEQVLLMNNERFAVPEVLFKPSDIGLCRFTQLPRSLRVRIRRKSDL
jgi:actin-related protein 6